MGGKETRGLEGIDDTVTDGPGEAVAVKGAGVGGWVDVLLSLSMC